MKLKRLYNKTIVLNFGSEVDYVDIVSNEIKFKEFVNKEYEKYPELFPVNFSEGYILYGQYHSKKVVC